MSGEEKVEVELTGPETELTCRYCTYLLQLLRCRELAYERKLRDAYDKFQAYVDKKEHEDQGA